MQWFAYAFLGLAEITVAYGIYYYNFNKCWQTNLHWIHLLCFCVPMLTLELLHQFVWLRGKLELRPAGKVPDMTAE